MLKFTYLKNLKPVHSFAFFGNFVVFLAALGLLVFRNNLPPEIPFWFSKPWGENRLAEPVFLWLLPTLIFITLVLNNVLGRIFFTKAPVLARILVWTSVFISFIFLFSLYRILLVVI